MGNIKGLSSLAEGSVEGKHAVFDQLTKHLKSPLLP